MDLKKQLEDFIRIINYFNSSISKIKNIGGVPYESLGNGLDRSGDFLYEENQISYRFHGAGCLIIYNGVSVNYDIVATGTPNTSIKITASDLLFFINSKSSLSKFEIEDVDESIPLLIEKKLIKKVPNTLGQYEVISINNY